MFATAASEAISMDAAVAALQMANVAIMFANVIVPIFNLWNTFYGIPTDSAAHWLGEGLQLLLLMLIEHQRTKTSDKQI